MRRDLSAFEAGTREELVIAAYRRYITLEPADRRLVLEAATLIALAWAGLRILRFGALRGCLARIARIPSSTAAGHSSADVIARVKWAVGAAAFRFPAATCLVQALAAETLLRRRGVECELRVGVRTGSRAGKAIAAHAWVDCGGAVAVGAIEDLEAYQLLRGATPR